MYIKFVMVGEGGSCRSSYLSPHFFCWLLFSFCNYCFQTRGFPLKLVNNFDLYFIIMIIYILSNVLLRIIFIHLPTILSVLLIWFFQNCIISSSDFIFLSFFFSCLSFLNEWVSSEIKQ